MAWGKSSVLGLGLEDLSILTPETQRVAAPSWPSLIRADPPQHILQRGSVQRPQILRTEESQVNRGEHAVLWEELGGWSGDQGVGDSSIEKAARKLAGS